MPMDMRLMIPRRRSSFNAGNFGTVLGTDGGAAIGTDTGAVFEIAPPSGVWAFTYRTGGVDDVGNMWSDMAHDIGIRDATATIVSMIAGLVNGSQLLVTDGTTSITLNVTASVSILTDPFFSIPVSNDLSAELFADGTPVYLSQVA